MLETYQAVRHFLVIHNFSKTQKVMLNERVFSIGRAPKNHIVIDNLGVSRIHAHLLRLPDPERGEYYFRIVDGSVEGRLSRNGITVNGQKCKSKDLKSGDIIVFGTVVSAEYVAVPVSEPLEGPPGVDLSPQRNIRSQAVDQRRTLVDLAIIDKSSLVYEDRFDELDDGLNDMDSPETQIFRR